ncbi:MAG: bestrophin family ion channel [Flavobacteriaceae bacterium]
MYIKRRYGLGMIIRWTSTFILVSVLYATAITIAFVLLEKYFNINLSLSWQPIGVLGIAVAFYLGFKNNASYDRSWEARKIWGSIVNNSRSFTAQLIAYTKGEKSEELISEIVNRHIAWLTALRFQLRLEKEWEHTSERLNNMFTPTVCELYLERLDHALMSCITEEEFNSYKGKTNMATQILAKQSVRLQDLRDQEYYEDFRHMELQKTVHNFYEDQGKSERIKGFPFPRQYASIALWLTFFFAVLIPFGLLDIFMKNGTNIWLTIPVSALIIWVFYLMEKIGDYSENPFEGTYNDVPITSIANTIEIDLKEMINATDIPPKTEPVNGFLM